MGQSHLLFHSPSSSLSASSSSSSSSVNSLSFSLFLSRCLVSWDAGVEKCHPLLFLPLVGVMEKERPQPPPPHSSCRGGGEEIIGVPAHHFYTPRQVLKWPCRELVVRRVECGERCVDISEGYRGRGTGWLVLRPLSPGTAPL